MDCNNEGENYDSDEVSVEYDSHEETEDDSNEELEYDSKEESDAETTKDNSLVRTLLKEYKANNPECKSQKDDMLLPKRSEKEKKQDNIVEAFIKDQWGKKDKKKTQKVPYIETTHKCEAEEVLKKSIITPDFETLHAVPRYDVSEKRLKLERKKEREKTKGEKWFGLPATEMTDEVKRDLEVIQMRSVLDPKHFYKKNDMKVLPKYFQIGKVMDTPLDYYNGRLTKKERKKTLVDELLADFEFRKYNKRKYKEIIQEKQKTHYKAWKQAKKLKKKK